MVARESYLLKTLYPLVNAQAEVESIIDGGSQIISMSSDVAIQVGATWDPDVTIQMQSANKQLEKTQGLVRNMPFKFGDEITVYFQVHVMQRRGCGVRRATRATVRGTHGVGIRKRSRWITNGDVDGTEFREAL